MLIDARSVFRVHRRTPIILPKWNGTSRIAESRDRQLICRLSVRFASYILSLLVSCVKLSHGNLKPFSFVHDRPNRRGRWRLWIRPRRSLIEHLKQNSRHGKDFARATKHRMNQTRGQRINRDRQNGHDNDKRCQEPGPAQSAQAAPLSIQTH